MKLKNLLDAFRAGGNGSPYVSIRGRQVHIEEQFQRYGIDMVDVLQLFKQEDLQVKPHQGDPDNLQEVHGRTVEGEAMAVTVSTTGYTIKVINVWLV